MNEHMHINEYLASFSNGGFEIIKGHGLSFVQAAELAAVIAWTASKTAIRPVTVTSLIRR